ncbi:MAG: type II toxin-antitoxin system PemK/MazF family toxin [Chloroflexota bacterium]
MSRPVAGSIALVDWRTGALPAEPTKRRPAVVVEDDGLFPDAYPNTLVVPLTTDAELAHSAFSVMIAPTPENGATARCWALAHHVTSVSLKRVATTASRVSAGQLTSIRTRIALAIGLSSTVSS